MPPEVQAFLGGITLADVALWVGIVGGVIAGFKWVRPFLRKLIDFVDDVAGEPARPGVPARPGLMERLASVEGDVAQVKHEVLPNTGTSLRDSADRTEVVVGELSRSMVDVHSKLDSDNARISDVTDRLDKHIAESSQILNSMKEKHEH